MLNNNGSGQPLYNSSNPFDGTNPPLNSILVKLTYYGDATLDGRVNAGDYSKIDYGFLAHLTGWSNGDFNYDGVINGSDYTLIDNAFNSQGAAMNAQVYSPAAGATAQVASISAVPEPAGLGLLGIGVVGMLGRRNRRRR
jgi:PEP-CTERM motif